MVPQRNREYSEKEKRRFARRPLLARLYRWWIWAAYETRFPAFHGSRLLSRALETVARRHLESQVEDPQLRQQLTPDYPAGGKRVLTSDTYYPALKRSNVHLVASGIERITTRGVVPSGRCEIAVDVIIFATGFESTSFLAPMEIVGRDGLSLHDRWQGHAGAYLGMTVPGFPNLFLMYGPNTNLGHNSIVFMIECQARYILDCIRHMRRRGISSLAVREDVMQRFSAQLQRSLARTVWAETPRSWYKTEDGIITNNWDGTTIAYWWKTRRVDLRCYEAVSLPARTEEQLDPATTVAET